jgi:hypothetical protein
MTGTNFIPQRKAIRDDIEDALGDPTKERHPVLEMSHNVDRASLDYAVCEALESTIAGFDVTPQDRADSHD